MPVGIMLRSMSAEELTEWALYYKMEPWGEERADLRAGMIAAPLLNAWSRKANAKPSRWIMRFDRPDEPEFESDESMKNKLRVWAAAFKKTTKPNAPVKPNPPKRRKPKP